MLSANPNWTHTFVASAVAVSTAATGLTLTAFAPAAPSLVGAGLLLTSLGATAFAFTTIAMRVRRIERENEGLIEELSQEFDRVKDKLEIFSEALVEPHSITPHVVENAPLRRVTIK